MQVIAHPALPNGQIGLRKRERDIEPHNEKAQVDPQVEKGHRHALQAAPNPIGGQWDLFGEIWIKQALK